MKIEIEDISANGLSPYFSLTERGVRKEGLFIAESPNVIHRALQAGFLPVSLLCEKKYTEEAESLINEHTGVPVYVCDRELIRSIAGYELTRGILCAMKRPQNEIPEILHKQGARICVLYDICDAINVGVIFRTAAALGYDAVVLSSTTCDPLTRRTTRVSMGGVFQIPWCYIENIPEFCSHNNIQMVSLALTEKSVWLQDFKVEKNRSYALVLGSEGYGLPADILTQSAAVVKIPMSREVDSLNVGAAAAIAMWHFRE